MAVDYVLGAELGDLRITWLDEDGDVIDFSSGWTFQLKLGPAKSAAAALTKTTGIVGAATAPNLTVAWAAGELDNLTVRNYVLQVKATRPDSKDRIMQGNLRIIGPVT